MTRCRIEVPGPHGGVNAFPVEALSQDTGEPPKGPKLASPWIRRTWAGFVSVRVGADSNAVAPAQGLLHEPFEGPPGGVDFHGHLHLLVVHIQVGVPPAHVGKDKRGWPVEVAKQVPSCR